MPNEPLWPFLMFEGLIDDALIDAYRNAYIETYVRAPDGSRQQFSDWTGAQVIFSERAFDHAFSSTTGFREGLDHDSFSLSRAKRMLWIKEVLVGNQGTIRRYHQERVTDRGRRVKRRTFVVCEENYVVVLDDPRKEGAPFQFVTAFVAANQDYLNKVIGRGALIQTRKNGK
jgi:hypothetical protein